MQIEISIHSFKHSVRSIESAFYNSLSTVTMGPYRIYSPAGAAACVPGWHPQQRSRAQSAAHTPRHPPPGAGNMAPGSLYLLSCMKGTTLLQVTLSGGS